MLLRMIVWIYFERFFWLGLYETHYPEVMPWLFEKDYGVRIWKAFYHDALLYRTNERKTEQKVRGPSHPPLLGYYLLVTITVIIGGLGKAILTYCGFSALPNTLDWIFAVAIGNGCVCRKTFSLP
jgi:hypothetical protein